MRNILGRLSHALQVVRYGDRIDPARDWFIMLTVTAVTLIAIISWNIWAFDRVARGGVLGQVTDTSIPIFNRTSLDTIQQVFEKRSGEAAKYENGTYTYEDPSL
jgi:hypothetical protein